MSKNFTFTDILPYLILLPNVELQYLCEPPHNTYLKL